MELELLKKYLRVDFDEDDGLIRMFLETAQQYVDEMVGVNYKENEKLLRLSEISVLKIVGDLYEQRSGEVTEKMKRDIVVQSVLDKLSNYTKEEI